MPTEVDAETANRVLENTRNEKFDLRPSTRAWAKTGPRRKAHWQVAALASVSIGFS
jgi:hypothetical protein